MPDLSFLFIFWSPETGANWNLIIGWIISLFFGRKLFLTIGDKISVRLLGLLNKIPMLENTDLDETFFKAIGAYLRTKVLAKMHDAQEIKELYQAEISAAIKMKDNEKVKALSESMREELEDLTKSIVDDFFEGSEHVLWSTLQNKYGDKIKAGKWVYDKVKALVEDMKDPSRPSTSALLAKHAGGALGELGNAL